jgi:GTPase SAR1 family protein
MEIIDVLGRVDAYNMVKDFLVRFPTIPLDQKRGLYIYGESGVGKTTFIMQLLSSLNYDIITYGSDCVRNVSLIEQFSNAHISPNSIVGTFRKQAKPMVIVLDDIDSMITGDRASISSLSKLFRPKKTKKQKKEAYNSTPIICVGTTISDKHIRELSVVCANIELNWPTSDQMKNLISIVFSHLDESTRNDIFTFTKVDISKMFGLNELYKDNPFGLGQYITNTEYQKIAHCDSKTKTMSLLNTPIDVFQHSTFLAEPERILVNKLWHENVVDLFDNNVGKHMHTYTRLLSNICYADYIDRITFQKQIWQLSEMSSLIKTCKNSHILHSCIDTPYRSVSDVRFTKILTKYSTEYNNFVFIRNICQTLNMDKRDLVGYINTMNMTCVEEDRLSHLEGYDIDQTALNRLSRYVHKYTHPSKIDTSVVSDETFDIDSRATEHTIILARDDLPEG